MTEEQGIEFQLELEKALDRWISSYLEKHDIEESDRCHYFQEQEELIVQGLREVVESYE